MASVSALIGRWPPAVQCGVWIILSGTLLTVQLAIVRHIADAVHVFEIVFFRSLFGLLLMGPFLLRGGVRHLRPNRPGLTLLCGVLAFAATVCFYFAAKHMPIADITAIHLSRPIFATIAAALILNEAIRGRRAAALVIGIVGAAVIIRPGFVEPDIGILYVLGVVAVQSWNPINRKLLSRSEHPDTVAVWVVLTVLPLGLVAMLFVWTVPTPVLLGWMGLVGVLEVANQRVLSRAYVQGDAVVVVGLHYTRLPIAALVGFLVFGEAPDLWVWAGAAVIAAGALLLAHGEVARGRAEKASRPAAPAA